METTPNASRRALLGAGAAVLGVAALSGPLSAQMDHSQHGPKGAYAQLIQATNHCRLTALACEKHCISALKTGDTELVDCLASVTEMLPVIEATNRYAILDATRLKELAAVCAQVCADCAKTCKKHIKEHKECKDCYDSCLECEKACKAVA
ncbi:MAG: Csp1 family four helix bundle copper storage protein [bacterium]|nr:Csp1 family four helix bundle copper storage protein [bacterium]